jgi:predicted nucleotidyltransferase component of viral defense system
MALFSFDQSEAFSSISFVGGTALRFLFAMPRYSEDLGFSLESANGYEPSKWLRKLKRDLVGSRFKTASWRVAQGCSSIPRESRRM